MNVTFEQARAFEAIIRLGTIQKAAKELNKGHSAVLYLIKSLEEQTGLKLFDRSGYRNKVTAEGQVVLKYCDKLLQTQNDLGQICKKLKAGWEPSLKLIYDGVIDFSLIAEAISRLNEKQPSTEVKILSAHLDEVEDKFVNENADMMVTILPIKHSSEFTEIKLKPIKMLLVAHRDHFLSRAKKDKLSVEELKNHTYIKITNTKGQLGLSTEKMDFIASFLVNDFTTKKQAILKKLGYGWLPEYLIEKELKNHSLQVLKTNIENQHVLKPNLFHKKEEFLGKTAKELLKHLGKS